MHSLWLPPRALARPNPAWVLAGRGTCPILILLHGAEGDETDWIGHTGLADPSRAPGSLARDWHVVCPRGGARSMYLNSPAYGDLPRHIVHELLPAARARLPHTGEVAIAGLSMGGFGAWHLALSHPGVFFAAASLSGILSWGERRPHEDYTERLFARVGREIFGPRWRREARAGRLAARLGGSGLPCLWADCGRRDPVLPSTRAVVDMAVQNNISVAGGLREGGHDWGYWEDRLVEVLRWLEACRSTRRCP